MRLHALMVSINKKGLEWTFWFLDWYRRVRCGPGAIAVISTLYAGHTHGVRRASVSCPRHWQARGIGEGWSVSGLPWFALTCWLVAFVWGHGVWQLHCCFSPHMTLGSFQKLLQETGPWPALPRLLYAKKTLPFFSVCLFLPLCLVVLRPLVPRSSHLFTSLSQAPNIHWTGFFCFCFFKNFNSYCRFRGYKCRFVTWVYVWYWGLGYDWNCHLGSERDAQ